MIIRNLKFFYISKRPTPSGHIMSTHSLKGANFWQLHLKMILSKISFFLIKFKFYYELDSVVFLQLFVTRDELSLCHPTCTILINFKIINSMEKNGVNNAIRVFFSLLQYLQICCEIIFQQQTFFHILVIYRKI